MLVLVNNEKWQASTMTQAFSQEVQIRQLSSDATTDEIGAEFIRTAFGYLDNALHLTTQMCCGEWAPDPYRGQCVLWMAHHACEVFLKGCIAIHDFPSLKAIHTLQELHTAFSSAHPTLRFDLPFGFEAYPSDMPNAEAMARAYDRTLTERLRYPVNKKMAPWGDLAGFEPCSFRQTLEQMRLNFISASKTILPTLQVGTSCSD